jgi:hypothetical protein
MRRALPYVLAGIAVFLVAVAVLLRFYALPRLLVTPLDQFAETIATGTGTTFDPATLSEREGVDLTAHRTVRGDVAASTRTVGVWDESLVVTDSDNTLINATTDRVAWDRHTGEAVNCCGENVNGVPTEHEGLSYKFPFNAEKKTYQFFDTTAKQAFPIDFKGTEELEGLTVYRYEQTIGPVQIGELEVPGSLVGDPSTPSVEAPRYYSNTRTVWVEPLTGIIVKGAEQQQQTLRDSAGTDQVTLIEVTLTFDNDTVKRQADLAKDGRSQAQLVGVWLPLIALILGLVIGVVAFLLIRREEHQPPAAALPAEESSAGSHR